MDKDVLWQVIKFIVPVVLIFMGPCGEHGEELGRLCSMVQGECVPLLCSLFYFLAVFLLKLCQVHLAYMEHGMLKVVSEQARCQVSAKTGHCFGGRKLPCSHVKETMYILVLVSQLLLEAKALRMCFFVFLLLLHECLLTEVFTVQV
jgi:hypothetical protein